MRAYSVWILAGLAVMAAEATSGETLQLRRVPVVDQTGFDKPIAAATVLIPSDWSGSGGVVWRSDPCVQKYYGVDLTVRSPDSTRSLNIHDFPGWHYSSNPLPTLPGMPACTATPYGSLDEFFRGTVPGMGDGATILQTRTRPDIIDEARAQGLVPPDPPQMPGLTIQNSLEAGEALIGFQVNGSEYRADLVCLLFMARSTIDIAGSQIAGAPSLPGVHHEELFGTPFCMSQAAPDGQLDFRLTDLFRKSYQPSAEWMSRIQQFNAGIAQTNAKGTADRFQITTQNAAEMNGIIKDIGDNQSASFDRTSRQSSDAILGVQSYSDPQTGGMVKLDNTYDHAWQLNDGSYVLSNDPNYNPNVDLGVTATELTPVP